MKVRTSYNWAAILSLVVIVLFSVACAGNAAQQTPGTPSPSERSVPTMPPARFTAVAQQVYTDTNTSAGAVEADSPSSTPDLERGATIYNNRCSSCHGEEGEGVANKGEALTGNVLSFAEFNDLLRTGGQGALGPEHLFGPNAISPSGLEILYAYVQTLSE